MIKSEMTILMMLLRLRPSLQVDQVRRPRVRARRTCEKRWRYVDEALLIERRSKRALSSCQRLALESRAYKRGILTGIQQQET
jgi:hypothetical protein